jgi:hypothetical protein
MEPLFYYKNLNIYLDFLYVELAFFNDSLYEILLSLANCFTWVIQAEGIIYNSI